MSKKTLKTDDNGDQIAYQLTNIASVLDDIKKILSKHNTLLVDSNAKLGRDIRIEKSLIKEISDWKYNYTQQRIGKYFFAGLAMVFLIIAILT